MSAGMGSTMTAPDAPVGSSRRPLAAGAIDTVREALADAVGVQRGL